MLHFHFKQILKRIANRLASNISFHCYAHVVARNYAWIKVLRSMHFFLWFRLTVFNQLFTGLSSMNVNVGLKRSRLEP